MRKKGKKIATTDRVRVTSEGIKRESRYMWNKEHICTTEWQKLEKKKIKNKKSEGQGEYKEESIFLSK